MKQKIEDILLIATLIISFIALILAINEQETTEVETDDSPAFYVLPSSPEAVAVDQNLELIFE